ncbi:lysylphosphatidylglycerol synthase transmembrane domain-containing protein [soil metagenome]
MSRRTPLLAQTARRALAITARVLFVVSAIGFAWWQLRGDWDDVVEAARGVGAPRWLQAAALTTVGTAITGFAWRVILTGFGHRIGIRHGLAVFFVGQLGKYIPGSVWSLGMQASLARRADVPAAVTVVTGLLFIGWHLATAVAIGSAGLLTGAIDIPIPPALGALALLGIIVVLSPRILNWLGTRTARADHVLRLRWSDIVALWVMFAVTWTSYGVALTRLAGSGEQTLGLGNATAAFAAAYTVGLVVIIAPAGLGAREVMLGVLLAPAIGTPRATAAVLTARVLFTMTDFALAFTAWVTSGRRSDRSADGAHDATAPYRRDTAHRE